MKKRAIAFLTAVILVFLSLFGRLFAISLEPVSSSAISHRRTREIDTVRGIIYDRSFTPLVNGEYEETLLILPTEESMNILKMNNADESTMKKLSAGYMVIKSKEATYNIASSQDIKIIKTYERYQSNSLNHIIGYLDDSGNGVCGIEKYFNEELVSQGGTLSITYGADATGRVLLGEDIEIRNDNYYDSDGIVLTIDKQIQAICEEAMINGGIEKGAAIVLDASTSDILASVSFPCYERDALGEYINSPDSPFINRAFTAYPVGSVFKVVTSAAYLEKGLPLPQFTCTGSIEKSGNQFLCSDISGHSNIDFSTALADSCNPYFIDLGTTVGADELLKASEKLGFGTPTDLGNGFMTDPGTLPREETLNSDAAVGNFAFGQGDLSATPLQIANLFATIARGGIFSTPSLIYGYTDKEGAFSPVIRDKGTRVLTEEPCETIQEALLKTATEGTGKAAFSSLYDCCTKTATAQSGQYDENGNEIMFCWFAGFFPAEDPHYVICILKEDGVSGGTDCAPVFKEIAERIISNGKLSSAYS